MTIVLQLIALGIAVILHEVAHGWVAEKCGDPTARLMGRITLNPLAHIDPIGSVILPLALLFFKSRFIIGWAKPVPVNFQALRHPKRDMIWVSLAGPGVNIILALISVLLLRIGIVNPDSLLYIFLINLAGINLVLAVFNLIPIPPLDGSKILIGLLPMPLAVLYSRLEPFGMFFILLLLMSGFFSMLIVPIITILARLIGVPL